MKKLITLLAAVSITGVSTTSVIACGVKVDPINIYFGDSLKSIKEENVNVGGVGYAAKQLAAAVTGSNYSYKTDQTKKAEIVQTAISFNQLNDLLFRVISNDSRAITKPQKNQKQLRNARDAFFGRQAAGQTVTTNGTYAPSVDGSRINSLETDIDQYYSKFNDTYINSINGLHDLSSYQMNDANKGLKALSESKKTADSLFTTDNPAQKTIVNDFYSSYYTSTKYAQFSGIRYELTDNKPFFQEYNTMSSTFEFTKKTGQISAPVNYQTYGTVNGVKPEDISEEKKKVVNSRPKSDPYGRLVINNSNLDGLIGTGNKAELASLNEADKFAEKLSPEAKINYIAKKDGDKYKFVYNPTTIYYSKVSPIKVTYRFAPDTKHSPDLYYDLSFQLENLVEVFTPAIVALGSTKTDDLVEKYQVIWVFAGYKFLDGEQVKEYGQKDVITDDAADKTYTKNIRYELNHQLRDLKTTNWTIKKSN